MVQYPQTVLFQEPLNLFSQVPIDVATVPVAAHRGRHGADRDGQAWGNYSEIQVKSFKEI